MGVNHPQSRMERGDVRVVVYLQQNMGIDDRHLKLRGCPRRRKVLYEFAGTLARCQRLMYGLGSEVHVLLDPVLIIQYRLRSN